MCVQTDWLPQATRTPLRSSIHYHMQEPHVWKSPAWYTMR